jgi:small nuclear ribonucleoprotein (snRNP)-like protein
MPIFDCPICHYKSFTEKESNEHYANKHQKEVQPTKPEVKKLEEKNKIKPAEPEVKKPEEPKKPFIMPDFVKRFLHKNVLITMIDGSTISGELTGFNNYDLMIDEKVMILKHAMIKMQEVETNP